MEACRVHKGVGLLETQEDGRETERERERELEQYQYLVVVGVIE